MTDKMKDNTKIHCDAGNCVWHTSDSQCRAGTIKVGSKTACSCDETSCSTFQLKVKEAESPSVH